MAAKVGHLTHLLADGLVAPFDAARHDRSVAVVEDLQMAQWLHAGFQVMDGPSKIRGCANCPWPVAGAGPVRCSHVEGGAQDDNIGLLGFQHLQRRDKGQLKEGGYSREGRLR